MINLNVPLDPDGRASRDLPFVVGVLGDFSGERTDPRPPLPDRKFFEVDRDNFDDVLRLLSPGLSLEVEAGGGNVTEVRLEFASMDDFEPGRLVERVDALRSFRAVREHPASSGSDQGSPPAGGSILDQVLEATGGGEAPTPAGGEDLSRRLAAILGDPKFRRLEASWRGLRRLVSGAETGPLLRIKVLDVTKKEIFRDLEAAVDFDRSWLFKKVYEEPFGSPPGSCEPFGVLLGDYEFTAHPDDLGLLSGLARVAAASSCPFVTGAGPGFFGLEDFGDLPGPGDLARILDGPAHARWRSLRDSEESRHLVLVLPRVLARLPHGKATRPVEGLDFEEVPEGRLTWEEMRRRLPWGSAVYLLGERIADSVAKKGWPGHICGVEGGGLVEGLPVAVALDGSGRPEALSMEVGIDEMKSQALTRGGLLPLLQYRNLDKAIFFASSTAHRPRQFKDEQATAADAIGSRLGCVLTVSRFLGALTLLGQQAVFAGGGPPGDGGRSLEERLNRWLSAYVRPDGAGDGEDGEFPLREGRIEVRPPKAASGLEVRAFLKPSLPYAGGDLPAPLKFTLRFA